MTAVLLLLDGCRWDYVNPELTPFLASRAAQGHHFQRVIPGLGFCERSEILTGRPPSDTGHFTAIGYDPARSAYRNLGGPLRLLALLESALSGKLMKRGLRKAFGAGAKIGGRPMRPYHIPFHLLPCFALTEDFYDHRDSRAFNGRSILDRLAAAGRSCYYDSFTALSSQGRATDQDRLAMALKAATAEHTLYLIYVGVLDQYGHRFGPTSPSVRAALGTVDQSLRQFVDAFESRHPGSTYIFLGDHGMVQVEKTVDIARTLASLAKRYRLKIPADYLYFLDSTLCRLWFWSEKARDSLDRAVRQERVFQEMGSFITRDVAHRERVPYADPRYGDLIWWANPGVLISPDFFHLSGTVRGMHGYDPGLAASQGMCIVHGPAVQRQTTPSIRLREVFGIISQHVGA